MPANEYELDGASAEFSAELSAAEGQSLSGSNPTDSVELSEQELDDISGGVDIFLSGSMFEQNDALVGQQGCGGAALAKTSSTASSTFQFIGLGFESNADVLGALEGVYKIFGRK